MGSGLATGSGPAGSGPATGSRPVMESGLATGAEAVIRGASQLSLNFCFKILENFVEIGNTSHFEVLASISISFFASKKKVYIKM